MRLHDRIRDERGSDLATTEPATIQAINRLTSNVHIFEFYIDLALLGLSDVQQRLYCATYLRLPFNFNC